MKISAKVCWSVFQVLLQMFVWRFYQLWIAGARVSHKFHVFAWWAGSCLGTSQRRYLSGLRTTLRYARTVAYTERSGSFTELQAEIARMWDSLERMDNRPNFDAGSIAESASIKYSE